jgi:hypothetical protein
MTDPRDPTSPDGEPGPGTPRQPKDPYNAPTYSPRRQPQDPYNAPAVNPAEDPGQDDVPDEDDIEPDRPSS